MPPRSLWTGSISFGLVNVPVRLYPAITEHKLHFRLVHEPDASPIGYEKVCKAEDKPVPDDEIVKAYETSKGEFVYLTDDDFAAARIEGYKSIDILDFVPSDDIDPIFFGHTYFAGPDKGAEHVYALLVRAMEESGLAAIAKFVMREQQHLGALRIRDGVIVLEQLHFADEIRPADELRPSGQKVRKEELAMAAQLIASFKGPWKPEKYEDSYRDALMKVIRAKQKGKPVHVAVPAEEEQPTDLLEALRQSVQRSRKSKAPAKRRKTRAAA